eukprot:1195331-Pleurochrysis_carterae.AAC.2
MRYYIRLDLAGLQRLARTAIRGRQEDVRRRQCSGRWPASVFSTAAICDTYLAQRKGDAFKN